MFSDFVSQRSGGVLKSRKVQPHRVVTRRLWFEGLEDRRLLSSATAFTLSLVPPVTGASIVAGTKENLVVTATNSAKTAATDYLGIVHFSTSDAQLSLPADYTFVAADLGTHSFPVTFKTAGKQTLKVADTVLANLTKTLSVTVTPAAMKGFSVTLPTPFPAGTSQSMVVTAVDAFGNAVSPVYQGKVAFSTTDTGVGVVLPQPYTFTKQDSNKHTFSVTLVTSAQNRPVTVFDVANPAVQGTAHVAVQAVPKLTALTLSQPAGTPATVAGTSTKITVTAVDQKGNQFHGQTPITVHFSSTDPSATLPANATLSSGSSIGKRTFGVKFRTAGPQTLTVTDTADGTILGKFTFTVNPGALKKFLVTGLPVQYPSGTPETLTVTAYDAYGNVKTDFLGEIIFSSNDKFAVLPPSNQYNFVAADQGKHSFSVTLHALVPGTVGLEYVRVADQLTGLIKAKDIVSVA